MEKVTINLGLITDNLSVRTFILPGPLNLPGSGDESAHTKIFYKLFESNQRSIPCGVPCRPI